MSIDSKVADLLNAVRPPQGKKRKLETTNVDTAASDADALLAEFNSLQPTALMLNMRLCLMEINRHLLVTDLSKALTSSIHHHQLGNIIKNGDNLLIERNSPDQETA